MNEQELIDRCRDALDEAAAGLDGRTRARLNQARQRALDAWPATARRAQQRPLWAFGLAAATAALLLWVAPQPSPERGSMGLEEPAPVMLDEALWAEDDSLDLAQNLEFYAWLELEADG
jgi:hypothetical protein